MVKKVFLYIFIYIILVGCESVLEPTNEVDYYLDISAPDLQLDSNGYYHIEFLDDYIQTFSTLTAETGSPQTYQKVGWMSDTEVNIQGYWTGCVNGNSYTDEIGEAHTVLSTWEILIGDTITVLAGYHDEFNNHYLDSLKVVVDNNI